MIVSPMHSINVKLSLITSRVNDNPPEDDKFIIIIKTHGCPSMHFVKKELSLIMSILYDNLTKNDKFIIVIKPYDC